MNSSPTGVPLLPVKYVPFLVALAIIAEGLAQVLPPHTMGSKVAHLAFAALSVMGLASPGLRKPAPEPEVRGVASVVKIDEPR